MKDEISQSKVVPASSFTLHPSAFRTQSSSSIIPTSTIVIPLVAGIGNALMTEPMIRQLRNHLPNAQIIALAISKPIAEVARRIEGVEVRVTGSGIKNLLKSAKAVRSQKPDVYLVPFPSNRWQYNLLAAASGAKRVVMHGYPKPAFSPKRFDRVPAVRGIHDVEQNLRLLSALSIEPDFQDRPRFAITDAEQQMAAQWVADLGLSDSSFVLMHAGSAKTVLAEAKRWPGENYAKLASEITQKTGYRVVLVEGPDELGLARSIASLSPASTAPTPFPLTGTLGQSAAFIAQSAFYVGTDSGLAHLAAAVGRRAITLFAPADPDRVCPYGNRDLVVQPEGLGEPAFLYPWESTKPKLRPGRIDDIKRITVEQVMKVVHCVKDEISHRDSETQRGAHEKNPLM